jgi:hypothetical protein
MKKMERKKTKGVVCRQHPHHVDIDFLSTICQVHTHLLTPLHYSPPHTIHIFLVNNICCFWTLLPL